MSPYLGVENLPRCPENGLGLLREICQLQPLLFQVLQVIPFTRVVVLDLVEVVLITFSILVIPFAMLEQPG